MPAVSQQQQKLFGLALAVKRGEVPRSEASEDVLDIVDSMSEKDIEDFASTKHTGLPKKVEAKLREMVREMMRETIVNEDHTPEGELYTVKPCNHPNEPWAVWEGDVRVMGFQTEEEAQAFADEQNREEGLTEAVSSKDLQAIKVAVEKASSFMSVGSELKKLGMKYIFATSPMPVYIVQDKSGNRVGIVNKKYATKPDFVVGDIAVGVMENTLKEGLFQDIMRAVKKGDGPFTLVVIKNNKVIKQVEVKTPQAIPANYSSLLKDFPNTRIRIEDATGKIVMGESVNEDVINELSADTYKNTVKAALQRNDSKGNSIAVQALQSFGKAIAKELAGKSFEVKGSKDNLAKGFYRGNSQKFINQFKMTFTGEGELLNSRDVKVFGSDEVHFRMKVEFQVPDNIGGFASDVKFRGYEKYKFPGVIQFSIKQGRVWAWYNSADTDLEFTRAGAREMAKLADIVVEAMDFPTKAKHNTIKQFDPMKPNNESVNEGIGTIALGVAGGLLLLKVLKFVLKKVVGAVGMNVALPKEKLLEVVNNMVKNVLAQSSGKQINMFEIVALQSYLKDEINAGRITTVKQIVKVIDTLSKKGKNESVNENFAKFDTLKMAVNQHEKGAPYYDKTRLINIFNQLSSSDQVKAKKQYSGYFGESVNEAKAIGKKIFSDAKGKLFFGYQNDDDTVQLVDYKTWKKLPMKDLSNEFMANRIINTIVKNERQFNKKVEYNMWSKKTNPSFEDRMDYFIKNNWISNITKTGIKESVVNEENEPTNPELWDRAIAAAKREYDVYPSAYANAFASKWYKENGGDWKTKKESVNESSVEIGDIVLFPPANSAALVVDRFGRSVTIKLASNGKKIKTVVDKIKLLAQDGVNQYRAIAAAQYNVNKKFGSKYDIGAGSMGSGTTFWNRAEEEFGDYKKLAHVADNGKITFYDKTLPSNVKKHIEDYAKTQTESVNEAKAGDFEIGDFIHFKSKNKTGMVKKISGNKVTIMTMSGDVTGDMKDIQVLYQDNVNEGQLNEWRAEEVLQQLGGRRFIAMTGAKNFVKNDKDKSIVFRVPKAKNSINTIRITLTSSDLYNVEFISVRGTNIKTVATEKGVYNDQLQAIFTKYTGLYTSL